MTRVEPMKHLHFDIPHLPMEVAPFKYEVARIAAQVADVADEAIVDAMIAAAQQEGLTDLYLIDKQFLFEAIKEKAEREKNAPLTLDELQQMDGEPVYVVDMVTGFDNQWCIVYVSELFPDTGEAMLGGIECTWFDFKCYGTKWLAYRRKPETAEKP